MTLMVKRARKLRGASAASRRRGPRGAGKRCCLPRYAWLAGAALLAMPAGAGGSAVQAELAAPLPARIADFLLLDAEIADVTHRIAVANSDHCPATIASTGLVLATAQEFAGEDRALLLGVTGGYPMVTGAPETAGNGPRFGDVVTAIDDVAVPAATGSSRSFAQSRDSYARLDAAAADGEVRLRYLRAGQAYEARLATVRSCAIRSQLTSGSLFNASTDGKWIEVTTKVAAFVRTPDELAAIIGHEMAHVVRGDRGPGHRPGPRLPATERERRADRLGIYLAARAGFDPRRAASIFARFGARQGLLHWLDPSHPGFTSRAAAVEAEAERIVAAGRRGTAVAIPPALL